jgi:hypothetical protein
MTIASPSRPDRKLKPTQNERGRREEFSGIKSVHYAPEKKCRKPAVSREPRWAMPREKVQRLRGFAMGKLERHGEMFWFGHP